MLSAEPETEAPSKLFKEGNSEMMGSHLGLRLNPHWLYVSLKCGQLGGTRGIKGTKMQMADRWWNYGSLGLQVHCFRLKKLALRIGIPVAL